MLVSFSEHHRAMRALGGASKTPEDFGCDVLFYVPDKKTGVMLKYGVQRKELTDFIQSAQDGRLYTEVAQMDALDQALLIIEGQPRFALNGEMLIGGMGSRWNRQAHLGMLWSIQMRGVWWCGVNTTDETADVCRMFEDWCRKEKHRALDTRPGPVSAIGLVTQRWRMRHTIMSGQGIGPELAEAILDEVGMPYGMVVDDELLLKVKNLGPKRLAAIKEAVGE